MANLHIEHLEQRILMAADFGTVQKIHFQEIDSEPGGYIAELGGPNKKEGTDTSPSYTHQDSMGGGDKGQIQSPSLIGLDQIADSLEQRMPNGGPERSISEMLSHLNRPYSGSVPSPNRTSKITGTYPSAERAMDTLVAGMAL